MVDIFDLSFRHYLLLFPHRKTTATAPLRETVVIMRTQRHPVTYTCTQTRPRVIHVLTATAMCWGDNNVLLRLTGFCTYYTWVLRRSGGVLLWIVCTRGDSPFSRPFPIWRVT